MESNYEYKKYVFNEDEFSKKLGIEGEINYIDFPNIMVIKNGRRQKKITIEVVLNKKNENHR